MTHEEYGSSILKVGQIYILPHRYISLLAGVVITVPHGDTQCDLYVTSGGGVAGGINDKTAKGNMPYMVYFPIQ
ncbi:MAG: hypothetical protein II393_04785 [Cytophagales bacterium]|nr:hypothetical protein [Cytophagales bacterium]